MILKRLTFLAAMALAGPVLAQTANTAPGDLDAVHAARAAGDAAAREAVLSPDAVWIGPSTEARADRPALIAAPPVPAAAGWRYRHVRPVPDPCDCLAVAEELTADGTTRGVALLDRWDGRWIVWRYAEVRPVPNDAAREITAEIRAFEAGTPPAIPDGEGVSGPEAEAVAAALDALHRAAAEADGATYFDLFAPDGVFVGTDASERWTAAEFRAYAEPYFAAGRGWTYVPRLRNVAVADTVCRCVAWFDEILDSEAYGTSRGAGVMVRDDDGRWRVLVYDLSFPIPAAPMDRLAPRLADGL